MLALLRRYWDDLVSYEGGLSLVMLDGLLLIPVIFAAFFYPVEILTFVGATALIGLVLYEGYVLWRKRHPRPV